MLALSVPQGLTWDSWLTAYQRGELVRLVLYKSHLPVPAVYVVRQELVSRGNFKNKRPGAARAFATEESARTFIARQHPELVQLPDLANDGPEVVGTWT
jgi:hypothetical protein